MTKTAMRFPLTAKATRAELAERAQVRKLLLSLGVGAFAAVVAEACEHIAETEYAAFGEQQAAAVTGQWLAAAAMFETIAGS